MSGAESGAGRKQTLGAWGADIGEPHTVLVGFWSLLVFWLALVSESRTIPFESVFSSGKTELGHFVKLANSCPA